jgi:hypothetical protein
MLGVKCERCGGMEPPNFVLAGSRLKENTLEDSYRWTRVEFAITLFSSTGLSLPMLSHIGGTIAMSQDLTMSDPGFW